MTNYVILFVKVPNTVSLNTLTEIRISKYFDSVVDYDRKWVKQEEVELGTLSNWGTSIRSRIRKRIYKLSRSMSSKVRSIFNDKRV